MKIRLSKHAEAEMRLRRIPHRLLNSVLQEPQQIVAERGNRKAYQSKVDFGKGAMFLLRAIVDDTTDPAVVVTTYRTRKIGKYWRRT